VTSTGGAHSLQYTDLLNGAFLGIATTWAKRRQCRRSTGKAGVKAVRGRSVEELFGSIKLHGAAAAFIVDVRRSIYGRGTFEPTPIQDECMQPILQGTCVAMQAPTGTGKTLAFMLPLWERFVERDRREAVGPPILIITPSEDLQQQIGIVGREVAGEAESSPSVLVLRRNIDLTEQRLMDAQVIVATPSLLVEQLEIAYAVMCKIVTSLKALVIDEADAMLPPGGARNDKLEEFLEFLSLARQGKGHDGVVCTSPAQIVACSASLDDNSMGLLEAALQCKFNLIKTGGHLTLRMHNNRMSLHGPPDDGEELWPPGLEHRAMLVDRVMDHSRKIRKSVLRNVVQAIGTVGPQRCLVILAEGKGNSERPDSLGKYLRPLRTQLSHIGYSVVTASAALSGPQTTYGIPEDVPMMTAGSSTRQVILGRCESIRGLDLVGVDLVVVVGEVANAREYVHVTGRTARWAPGLTGFPEGMVVCVVDRFMYRRLKRWSRHLHFRLDMLHLKSNEEVFRGPEFA